MSLQAANKDSGIQLYSLLAGQFCMQPVQNIRKEKGDPLLDLDTADPVRSSGSLLLLFIYHTMASKRESSR